MKADNTLLQETLQKVEVTKKEWKVRNGTKPDFRDEYCGEISHWKMKTGKKEKREDATHTGQISNAFHLIGECRAGPWEWC